MEDSRQWEQLGDELKLRDGTQVSAVPAVRLFRHAFRGGDAELPVLPSPDRLRFSRTPLDLCVEAGFLFDGQGATCRVVAEHAAIGKIEVADIHRRESDHIIVRNIWFPFAHGALDQMRRILDAVGVARPGPINLRQLLDFRQLARRTPGVIVRTGAADPGIIGSAATDVDVAAKLYKYQEVGVGWLRTLARECLGGILADEMGLGKTLQVIALVVAESATRPALVVSPVTLLANWRREFSRFAPQIKVLVHHGYDRTGFPAELTDADVVIVPYETLVRDLSLFRMVHWGAVVLDEAQNIRNPDATRTEAVKSLKRNVSIAVTGTPVENRLEDLWSLSDFAVPGYLGDRKTFLAAFEDNPHDARRIAELMGPFILRRRVHQVARDLPERIDVPQPLEFPPWLAQEYEQVRQQIATEYGRNAGFAGLVRLRQFCVHPFLLEGLSGDPAIFSPKYARLIEILEEIQGNREKALVFTSFVGMIDLLVHDIPRRLGVSCMGIDGRTRVEERQEIVDRFADATESEFLVLNPYAGGTGLNITAANHVIHLHPEWNPATQEQASARAYRRGQERPVTVHLLYYVDTVEQVMVERMERKRLLADAAVPVEDPDADRVDIARALLLTPALSEGGAP